MDGAKSEPRKFDVRWRITVVLALLLTGVALVPSKIISRHMMHRSILGAVSPSERVVALNLTGEDDFDYWYLKYLSYARLLVSMRERITLAGLLAKERKRAVVDLTKQLDALNGDSFRNCSAVLLILESALLNPSSPIPSPSAIPGGEEEQSGK